MNSSPLGTTPIGGGRPSKVLWQCTESWGDNLQTQVACAWELRPAAAATVETQIVESWGTYIVQKSLVVPLDPLIRQSIEQPYGNGPVVADLESPWAITESLSGEAILDCSWDVGVALESVCTSLEEDYGNGPVIASLSVPIIYTLCTALHTPWELMSPVVGQLDAGY